MNNGMVGAGKSGDKIKGITLADIGAGDMVQTGDAPAKAGADGGEDVEDEG